MGTAYDLHADIAIRWAYKWTLLGAGVDTGQILDTRDFKAATLVMGAWQLTAAQSAVIAILESDDSGMAGATVIPNARVLSNGYPVLNEFGPLGTPQNEYPTRTAVLSPLRFIQPQITRSGAGSSFLWGLWLLSESEHLPTDDTIVVSA